MEALFLHSLFLSLFLFSLPSLYLTPFLLFSLRDCNFVSRVGVVYERGHSFVHKFYITVSHSFSFDSKISRERKLTKLGVMSCKVKFDKRTSFCVLSHFTTVLQLFSRWIPRYFSLMKHFNKFFVTLVWKESVHASVNGQTLILV